ncbi:uncharacterized protein C8R40DRAFT_1164404 [Lentinula edodes]|uniref:uncharacterized protein n=1 Tax=Lentinula edodes TaxID=5353 RepID=UPI001E8E9B09|nr:uncharacterized protein C8R40DRAFT_1164404 [Lentinula edodes]KAH7880979.1 hypothetical protein C8R40DRAFT_1164404 [Lentinula edodes]
MIIPINVNTLQVSGVVSFYMSAALVMVFVNKLVLNNTPDLPLLFLLAQLLIAVVLLHVSAAISHRVEIPHFDWGVAKKLTPVVLVNVIGLVFNTLCLRGVEASYFQIARGLQLPLTILVSSIYTRCVPSIKTIAAAVLVSCGFFVGVAPSSALPSLANPTPITLFYGILSSLFIALHAVLIKSSLPHCENSTIQLAWWTNVGSAVFLLPFVVFNGELQILRDNILEGSWDGKVFGWGCLVTGVFGFLLCVAGLLSIKVTSPITHMFSSAAKSVLQTLLGVYIFHDILTVNRISSILIILGGTMYYTWAKSFEFKPPQPEMVDLESARRPSQMMESRDSKIHTVVWSVDEEEKR